MDRRGRRRRGEGWEGRHVGLDLLFLANEMGCAIIIIQSDCLQVIETLQIGCFSPALFYDIYVLASLFSACEFSFYNREANVLLTFLSRETDALPLVWVG
jgi:hypothetical protein